MCLVTQLAGPRLTLFCRTYTDLIRQFVILTETECTEHGGKRDRDMKGRKK